VFTGAGQPVKRSNSGNSFVSVTDVSEDDLDLENI